MKKVYDNEFMWYGIEFPEDCPHLDEDNVACDLDNEIVCSPYFARFPEGCPLENCEDAE